MLLALEKFMSVQTCIRPESLFIWLVSQENRYYTCVEMWLSNDLLLIGLCLYQSAQPRFWNMGIAFKSRTM